jgi:phage-related minor tail protein
MSSALRTVKVGTPLMVAGGAAALTLGTAAAVGYGLSQATPDNADFPIGDPMGIGVEAFDGGMRAKGGPVSPGRTYLVGEKGPEPFTPTRSGYVHPSGAGLVGERGPEPFTPARSGYVHPSGAGAVSVTVHVAPKTLAFSNVGAADAQAIAERVKRMLQDEIGAAMRGVFADLGRA